MTNPDDGYNPDWSNVARPRGSWVIVGLVLLGVMPAGLYAHYKVPRLSEESQLQVDLALGAPEDRIKSWHHFGAPNIHHRIATVGRISEETPWIVTHQVELDDGGPPEVWGIDASKLPGLISRIDGMTIIVELPEPVALGRVNVLSLDSRQLPTFASYGEVPDPNLRLQALALWFLEKLPQALAAGVPGAKLEVRITSSDAPSQD